MASGTELSGDVARLRKDDFAVIVECDEGTTELVGWSHEELVGRRSLDFVHPDDQQRAVECWVAMLEAPEQVQCVRWRHRCKDGSYKSVAVTSVNLLRTDGYVLAEMVEVANQLHRGGESNSLIVSETGGAATMIARIMREREGVLRRLTESLPTGVALTTPQGTLLYANARIRKLLGSPTATTVAELFATVVDDDRSALSTALEAALGDNRDEDVEVRVRTPRSPFPTRCLVNIRMVDDQISAINGALLCVSDVTDSARLREELERRATIDTLTGCRNRPSTLAFLEDVLASGAPAAVAFIDVNGFKAVNDGFGHAAGDDLLEDVGARLMTTARAGDVVGRLGGDEFLLICPGVADPSAAWAIASRAAEALQDLAPLGRTTLEPIASIGVAHAASGSSTPDQLIAAADTAMYEAKRARSPLPVLFSQGPIGDAHCA